MTATSIWTDASAERRRYPPGFWETDERDWVGIQSAIVAAHEAGGGTVVIPDTGFDYLSDRSIWVFSNVRLLWLTDGARESHSFLRMTERSFIAGGFIVSYNEFLAARNIGEIPARHALNFVCRARLIEPRLRTLPGENAIGFALGSYDVQIHGGILEGADWGGPDELEAGFSELGGKAIQCEAGVIHAVVRDTLIRDSAMGINATTTFPFRSCSPVCAAHEVEIQTGGACQCTDRFAPTYFRAASRIDVQDVTFKRVQAPVSAFYTVFWPRFSDPSVRAVLERASPQDALRFSDLTVRDPRAWSGCIARPYAGAGAGEYSGVVNLTYATHVTVSGVTIENNAGWPQPLVRGTGRDIRMRDVQSESPLRRILEPRFPYGNNGSYPRMEAAVVEDIRAPTITGALVLLPAKTSPFQTIFIDTQLSGVVLEEPAPSVFGGAVEDYEAAELASPFLSVE